MTQVRLKYLHSFTDRHGHVRFYFRYRGNRWPVPAPHEEGFATAYDALLTEIKSNPIVAAKLYVHARVAWLGYRAVHRLRPPIKRAQRPRSEIIGALLMC